MNTSNNSPLKFDETGTIVRGCDKSAVRVVIPDGVTAIGNCAFRGCTTLSSIEIPNSVNVIEAGAFSGCESLPSIEIPNSVTAIGDEVFWGCKSLPSIEIPNSVTAIGDGAFDGCKSLTYPIIVNDIFVFLPPSRGGEYSIPYGIKTICGGAFSGCTSLTSIEIPNSVTAIGNWAFAGCGSLTSIEIPNSVTAIGDEIFGGCTSLTSIEIPNSVTAIGSEAFADCTSLTSIEIPNSVTTIGIEAFANCSSLKSITVSKDNPNYVSIDGILFDKDWKTILVFPGGKKTKSYSLPESIECIENGAFRGCQHLETIMIHEGVKSIGQQAFDDSPNLREIYLWNEDPDSIEVKAYYYYHSFSGLKNCTLFVPIGTGYAYRHHPNFEGRFKEIKIEKNFRHPSNM